MLRAATRELSKRRCVAHHLLSCSPTPRRPFSCAPARRLSQFEAVLTAREYAAPRETEAHDHFADKFALRREGADTPGRLSKSRTEPWPRATGAEVPLSDHRDKVSILMSYNADHSLEEQEVPDLDELDQPSPKSKFVSPQSLLTDVLRRGEDWKFSIEKAARARSTKPQILVLQKLLRTHPELDTHSVKLLPEGNAARAILLKAAAAGHSSADIDRYTYILDSPSDEERCRRFLEGDGFKPAFLWRYLVRRTTTLASVDILEKFIAFFGIWLDRRQWEREETTFLPEEMGRKRLIEQDTSLSSVQEIASLLAEQCHFIEPRMLLNLAGAITGHVKSVGSQGNPRSIHVTRSFILNAGLRLFRPFPTGGPPRGRYPNAYLWGAQQLLLRLSSTFEKPLTIDLAGFRAIRDVLAGMPKNGAEMHSSVLQSLTWPPYLKPGDGLDESSAPEDQWSRVVQAGMMMQQAGDAKEADDESLDVLQGMAPDGTPTIQQRTRKIPWRLMSRWEALIKATRNEQEAWQQFLNPPDKGLVAGPWHYAAVLEKLVRREVEPMSTVRPGDVATNFPVHTEPNLAEIEQARLQAPSFGQVYEHMLTNGVAPVGTCLRILVYHAEDVETAHGYLRDSKHPHTVACLMEPEPDPDQVRRVPRGILTAYIRMLCNSEGARISPQLQRAIGLVEMHLSGRGETRHLSDSLLWEPILKCLSRKNKRFGTTVDEQLHLALQLFQQIEQSGPVTLAVFTQLGKCIRKIVRRELRLLLSNIADPELAKANPLRYLYDRAPPPGQGNPSDAASNSRVSQLRAVAERLKRCFDHLALREKRSESLLDVRGLSVLDRMTSRRDPVTAGRVYQYMVTMAFAGEFEEMERMLRWLIEQWGRLDVVEAVGELDEVPEYADFSASLCLFRMLAEPMLEEGRGEALRASIEEAGLHWAWPDEEALEAYEKAEDEGTVRLERILQWIRYNRELEKEEEEMLG